MVLALGCTPWGVAAVVWLPGSPLLVQLHSWQGPMNAAHQLMMIPWWNDTCLITPRESPAMSSVVSGKPDLRTWAAGTHLALPARPCPVANHVHMHLTGAGQGEDRCCWSNKRHAAICLMHASQQGMVCLQIIVHVAALPQTLYIAHGY